MSPLVIGVVVYAIVTGALGLVFVVALRRARAEGLSGSVLLSRLLPLLIADMLFTVLWVVWLLGVL